MSSWLYDCKMSLMLLCTDEIMKYKKRGRVRATSYECYIFDAILIFDSILFFIAVVVE